MTDYIKLCVDIPKDVYNNMIIKNEYTERDVIAIHNALMDAAVMRARLIDHERIFENIIVRYPPEEICIYPEYKGKAYFSIQYEEKGEHFVGFGTYNPEALSRYLIDYFITPIIIETNKKGEEEGGIIALDTIRDCETCAYSKDGKCAGTEECHDCMFESRYIKLDLDEERAILKVPNGQDPYTVIGQYIRDHITAIEDIIATIELDGIRTNELFIADMKEDGYFVWQSDWWEGEKNIALIDFFPVSDAIADREGEQE